jgi:hypothetical protein
MRTFYGMSEAGFEYSQTLENVGGITASAQRLLLFVFAFVAFSQLYFQQQSFDPFYSPKCS